MRPLLKLETGGGLEKDSREGFRDISWSRDAEARKRGFRPGVLALLESWSREADALSLGAFNSDVVSLRTELGS